MAHKRLFLAIPLPQHILAILEHYQKSLSLDMVRWIPITNLHITLYFIGNVDEHIIDKLIDLYSSLIASHQQFSLYFKAITFMPLQNPRMIWAEFNPSALYLALHENTQKTLRLFFQEHKQTCERDKKSTIPHVTMARTIKSGFINPFLPQPDIPEFLVNEVQLVASQLSHTGSVYSVLNTFSL